MNPPYSIVCAGRHVLADDVARQPPIADNGAKLCTESGCLERVYTHCPNCSQPLPGYIDGPRYEVSGNIAAPRGRIGTSRGLSADRTWRELASHDVV
jgi:hypothetical protein